jgi:hypothetical protein
MENNMSEIKKYKITNHDLCEIEKDADQEFHKKKLSAGWHYVVKDLIRIIRDEKGWHDEKSSK